MTRQPLRLRVLLVEDHEPTARAMEKILREMQCEVLVARNLHAALQEAQERHFDLIISDIGLPDGSGIDLISSLKSHATRAIAISGYGTEDDIRRSITAGFSEHLVKPINLQQLRIAIERQVARHQPH